MSDDEHLHPEARALLRDLREEAKHWVGERVGPLSETMPRLIADARRLFCSLLDYELVGGTYGDAVPREVIPEAMRGEIAGSAIVAQHEAIRVLVIRTTPDHFTSSIQNAILAQAATHWPGSILLFTSYAGDELELCQAQVDGLVRRAICGIEGNARDLAQVWLSLRGFEPATDEPRQPLAVSRGGARSLRAQRIRRRLKRVDWFRSPVHRAISRHPLLTKVEEQALGRSMTPGVRDEAWERLFHCNLRLALKWAKVDGHWTYGIDDAVQIAVIALMKAVDGFDVETGFKFSTYATTAIKRDLWRITGGGNGVIRMPSRRVKVARRMLMAEKQMYAETGVRPSPMESALAAGVGAEEVPDALRVRRLYTGGIALSELVERAGHCPDPSDQMCQAEDEVDLHKLLGELREREADVLRWRYGIGETEAMTLEACGDRIGVTRERVRQIEKKALDRLRQLLLNVDAPSPADTSDQTLHRAPEVADEENPRIAVRTEEPCTEYQDIESIDISGGRDWLRLIAQRARSGEQPRVSVRNLLHAFGKKGRGWRVVKEIRDALREHHLTSSPSFEAAGLNDDIRLSSLLQPDREHQEQSKPPSQAAPSSLLRDSSPVQLSLFAN